MYNDTPTHLSGTAIAGGAALFLKPNHPGRVLFVCLFEEEQRLLLENTTTDLRNSHKKHSGEPTSPLDFRVPHEKSSNVMLCPIKISPPCPILSYLMEIEPK